MSQSDPQFVRIVCPLCKKPVMLDPMQSGMKFSCPHCSQRIQAPDLPKPKLPHPRPTQKTMLAAVEEGSPPSHLPPPFEGPLPKGSWWTKEKAMAIFIPAGLVLVLCIILIIVLATRPSTHDASTILTDYENGRGDRKYKDRKITVRGTVGVASPTTRPGESGIAFIDRGTGGSEIMVMAFFQGQDRSVLSLRNGSRATFTGYCTGQYNRIVIRFEDCQFVSSP